MFALSELTEYSCIYQDDQHDWGIEASRMKDTYRNAAFCIAATHAADSTVGLFHDRDDRGVRPVDVHIDWSNPRAVNGASMRQSDMLPIGLYSIVCEHLDEHRLVDDAPLNQRAWYVGLLIFEHLTVAWPIPRQQKWCPVYGKICVASTLPYHIFLHRALYVQIIVANQTGAVRDNSPPISIALTKFAKSNNTSTFSWTSQHVLTPGL